MKIAVCDDDPKAVGMFDRYAAAVIKYAVEYEFYQSPEEMLEVYAGQEQTCIFLILRCLEWTDLLWQGKSGAGIPRH